MLKKLEAKAVDKEENVKEILESHKPSQSQQLQIFDMTSEAMKSIEKIMKNVDVQAMTPIECMLKLKELEDHLAAKN